MYSLYVHSPPFYEYNVINILILTSGRLFRETQRVWLCVLISRNSLLNFSLSYTDLNLLSGKRHSSILGFGERTLKYNT